MDLIKRVCRDFMNGKCERENCRFIHDSKLCKRYYKNYRNNGVASCKFKDNCRKNHFVSSDLDKATYTKRIKNTESWEPVKRYDLTIKFDLSAQKLSNRQLGSGDVLIAPNVFKGDSGIYDKLVEEISLYQVRNSDILKLWHGSEERNISGTHLICNDRTDWKEHSPTFKYVIDTLKTFFGVRVEATRLNWYTSYEQWKPLHRDSAAIDPNKAKKQNITIAVSFGAERDIVFENVKTKEVICIPQGDSCVYTFGNKVNEEWRHGVQPGKNEQFGPRISVIIWGWIM